MNLLPTGDWHLTARKPINRSDDYVAAQRRKVSSIVKAALKHNAVILQPGDFFDRPTEPYHVLAYYAFLLAGVDVYTIYGQHDLRYHSVKKDNTPLNVFSTSRVVQLLWDEPTVLDDDVHLYGAGWESPMPEIKDEKAFNVLLIHEMIIDEKLWAEQAEFEWAKGFLKQHRFDLVVSGDNHKYFTQQGDGRLLVNAGSLMRSTTAQFEHEPAFVIYDTDTHKWDKHTLSIAPADKVFNVSSIVEDKERNEKLEAFIEGLSDGAEIEGLDFMENLHTYLLKNEVDEDVKEAVYHLVGEGYDRPSNQDQGNSGGDRVL